MTGTKAAMPKIVLRLSRVTFLPFDMSGMMTYGTTMWESFRKLSQTSLDDEHCLVQSIKLITKSWLHTIENKFCTKSKGSMSQASVITLRDSQWVDLQGAISTGKWTCSNICWHSSQTASAWANREVEEVLQTLPEGWLNKSHLWKVNSAITLVSAFIAPHWTFEVEFSLLVFHRFKHFLHLQTTKPDLLKMIWSCLG